MSSAAGYRRFDATTLVLEELTPAPIGSTLLGVPGSSEILAVRLVGQTLTILSSTDDGATFAAAGVTSAPFTAGVTFASPRFDADGYLTLRGATVEAGEVALYTARWNLAAGVWEATIRQAVPAASGVLRVWPTQRADRSVIEGGEVWLQSAGTSQIFDASAGPGVEVPTAGDYVTSFESVGPLVLSDVSGSLSGATWSPDGNWRAVLESDAVWRSVDGELWQRVPFPAPVTTPHRIGIAEDGSMLLVRYGTTNSSASSLRYVDGRWFAGDGVVGQVPHALTSNGADWLFVSTLGRASTSTDGGVTWSSDTDLGVGANPTVTRIGEIVFASGPNGLTRWSMTTRSLVTTDANSVVNAHVATTSGSNMVAAAQVGGSVDVWTSADDGATWSAVGRTQIPHRPGSSFGQLRIGAAGTVEMFASAVVDGEVVVRRIRLDTETLRWSTSRVDVPEAATGTLLSWPIADASAPTSADLWVHSVNPEGDTYRVVTEFADDAWPVEVQVSSEVRVIDIAAPLGDLTWAPAGLWRAVPETSGAHVWRSANGVDWERILLPRALGSGARFAIDDDGEIMAIWYGTRNTRLDTVYSFRAGDWYLGTSFFRQIPHDVIAHEGDWYFVTSTGALHVSDDDGRSWTSLGNLGVGTPRGHTLVGADLHVVGTTGHARWSLATGASTATSPTVTGDEVFSVPGDQLRLVATLRGLHTVTSWESLDGGDTWDDGVTHGVPFRSGVTFGSTIVDSGGQIGVVASEVDGGTAVLRTRLDRASGTWSPMERQLTTIADGFVRAWPSNPAIPEQARIEWIVPADSIGAVVNVDGGAIDDPLPIVTYNGVNGVALVDGGARIEPVWSQTGTWRAITKADGTGIWRSDDGETWELIPTPVPMGTSLRAGINDDGEIMAAYGGAYRTRLQTVFHFANGEWFSGEPFFRVSPANIVAHDDSWYYMSTVGALYWTDDDGRDWVGAGSTGTGPAEILVHEGRVHLAGSSGYRQFSVAGREFLDPVDASRAGATVFVDGNRLLITFRSGYDRVVQQSADGGATWADVARVTRPYREGVSYANPRLAPDGSVELIGSATENGEFVVYTVGLDLTSGALRAEQRHSTGSPTGSITAWPTRPAGGSELVTWVNAIDPVSGNYISAPLGQGTEASWFTGEFTGTPEQPLADATTGSPSIRKSPSGIWTLVVTPEGLLRSNDGQNWLRIGLPSIFVGSFVIRDNGTIIGFSFSRGIGLYNPKVDAYRFSGAHWRAPQRIGESVQYNDKSLSFASNGDKLMALTRLGQAFYTLDNGATWQNGGRVGRGDQSNASVRQPVLSVVGDMVHSVGYRPYFGFGGAASDPYLLARWSFETGRAVSVTGVIDVDGEEEVVDLLPYYTSNGDMTNRPWQELIFDDPINTGGTWRMRMGYGLGLNLWHSTDEGNTWDASVVAEPMPVGYSWRQPVMLASGQLAFHASADTGSSVQVFELRWDLEDRSWGPIMRTDVVGASGGVFASPGTDAGVPPVLAPALSIVGTGGNIWSVPAGSATPVVPEIDVQTARAGRSFDSIPASGALRRVVSPSREWELIATDGLLWRSRGGESWERIVLPADLRVPTSNTNRPPVTIMDDGTIMALSSREFSVGFYERRAVFAWYYGDTGWMGSQRIGGFGRSLAPSLAFTDGSTLGAIVGGAVYYAEAPTEEVPGRVWKLGNQVADGPNPGETFGDESGAVAPGIISYDIIGDVVHLFGNTGGYSRWSLTEKKLIAFAWDIETLDLPGGIQRTVTPITISSAGGASTRAASADGSPDNISFFTPGAELLTVPSEDGGATFGEPTAELFPVPISIQQTSTSTDSVRFLSTANCTTARLVYAVSHSVTAEPGLTVVPVYLDESRTAALISSTAGGTTAATANEAWFTVADGGGGRALVGVDSTLVSPEAVFGFDGYGITANGVNTSIGNFVHEDVDAAIATVGVPLEVARTYNSADGRIGLFGRGWTSNYEIRVFENCITGDATILHGDGRREQHYSDGANGYLAAPGYTNRLVKNGSTGWTLNETDGTTHDFRSDGRLTTMTTADGHRTDVAWTGTGSGAQLTTVTDVVSGRQLTFNYDGAFVSSVSTTPVTSAAVTKQLTWNYTYADGSLAEVCDPRDNTPGIGNCTMYTVDNGVVTTVTDANGNVDRQVGYVAGKVAWEENGEGDRTTFEYVDVTTTIVTDPNGRDTTTVVDERRRTVRVVDPLGNATTYGYDDDSGFRTTATDGNGNVVTSTFDERGNALSTTNGAGETTYFEYDEFNNVLATRDARSAGPNDDTYLIASTWSGVTRRQLSESLPPTAQQPGGVTTTWGYTDGSEPAVGGGLAPAGLLRSETDGNGAVTSLAYDSSGNLRRVVDRVGLVTEYAYDELGRRIAETQISTSYPAGVVTTTVYDEVDNELIVTGAATTNDVTGATHRLQLSNSFDSASNLVQRVERDIGGAADAPADRIATYTYDEADRPISAADPEGGVASRTYDAAGNVITTIDEESRRFEFDFDERNLQTSVTGVALVADEGQAQRNVSLGQSVYDAGGRLVESIDPLGRVTRFAYDGANRQVTATRVGHEDLDGTVRDVELMSTTYVDGFPVQAVTGGGLRTEARRYDESGRQVETVLDPGGLDRVAASEFDANGNVVRSTLSDGTRTEETRYVYDDADRLIEQTEENGDIDISMAYEYDDRGVLTSETDARGFAPGATPEDFRFEYESDALGRIVTTIAPKVSVSADGTAGVDGRPQASTGLDAFGQVNAVSDERGFVTRRSHDRLGRMTEIAHPQVTGPVTGTVIDPTETFIYDAVGNLVSRTDRRGNTTQFAFDGLNRIATQTDPAVGADPAGVWRRYYDDAGNVVAEIDQRGARVEVAYDSFDRTRTVTSVVRNDGGAADRFATTYDYDDLGNVLTRTSPAGDVVTSTYSSVSEALTTTDAEGNVSAFSYDVAARQISMTDPLGRRLATEYDLAGRPIGSSSFASDGTLLIRSAAAFDASGNVISATLPRGLEAGIDPLDFSQTYQYDAIGRLVSTAQPTSDLDVIETEYRFDAAGNLTGLVDGRDNLTRYAYNAWNLRSSIEEPAVAAEAAAERTWLTEFDAGGLPLVVVEPGGVSVTRTFDELGRLTVETGAGPDVVAATRSFSYDAAGLLTGAESPSGPISFEYDDRGLLIESSGSPTYESEFEYDAVGRMVARTDASGTSTFTYTARDQLESVSDGLSGTTRTNGFDEAGQLVTVAFDDGVGSSSRVLAYDDLGRLTNDTLTDGAGATTASYGYGYDADGNVISKNVEVGSNPANGEHSFTYDNAGRITTWTDPAGNASPYRWDTSGNLTTNAGVTQTFDSRNRLTQTGTSAYDWTARGTLDTVTTVEEVGGTITIVDEFDQADGSAPLASIWRTTVQAGATALVDSGALSIEFSDVASSYAVIDNLANSVRDSETTLAFSFASNETNDRARIRVNSRFGTDRVWVDLYSHNGLGRLYQRSDGTTTLLASFNAAVTTDEQQLKIVLDGSDVTVTTWLSGDAEPVTPTVEATTDAVTAGRLRIQSWRLAGSNEVRLDDISVRGIVRDEGVPLISDEFGDAATTRPDPTIWREFERGSATASTATGAYVTTWSDEAASYSLIQSHETVAADAELSVDYAFDSTSASDRAMLRASVRYSAAGRVWVDIRSNSTTARVLQRANGATTVLGTFAVELSTDPKTLRVALVGDELNVRTWTVGDLEPVDWAGTFDVSDVPGAGRVRLESRRLSGVNTVRLDNFAIVPAASGRVVAEQYAFDALGRAATTPGASYTYDSMDRIATADDAVFSYAGFEIDPVGIDTTLIARSPGSLPIATQRGTDPAVLLGRNAHGDVGYVHDAAGTVSSTSVFDPFGGVVGNESTGSLLGFQGDYTDQTTGDVWMGARWYRPGTGGFVSRDTVFGQLQTPMSVNRYTYALGDPLGRWDPDGRCSLSIGIRYTEASGKQSVCTDDLNDVISHLEQRSNDFSQAFMSSMLAGLRTVAENPLVSLVVPGVDCAIIALDKAQGEQSGAMDYAGCGLDVIPGLGKVASKTVKAGGNVLLGGRRAANAADRAGDVGRRVDDVPALNRVEAPSVNRVAPEPPVARAPETKSFDPPDPATRRSGPDANGGNSGGRRGASDPPCNSFTGETGILMADGSVVAIEDVELGDWVLAADPETGEFGPRQVTRLIFGSGEKTLVGITVDGATVTATDEHPIWVDSDGEWVDAEDVRVGDVLLTPDGVAVVDAVTVETVGSAEVFNLTVDDLHTFYVLVGDTPVLTHNQGAGFGDCSISAAPNTAPGRWTVGDDIYAPTAAGTPPKWSTTRSRFWKNEAANPQIGDWSPANLDRMKSGGAPRRYNPDKGGMESMELSHEPIPFRDGGTSVVPRWPQDHAAVDPYRRPGY